MVTLLLMCYAPSFYPDIDFGRDVKTRPPLLRNYSGLGTKGFMQGTITCKFSFRDTLATLRDTQFLGHAISDATKPT